MPPNTESAVELRDISFAYDGADEEVSGLLYDRFSLSIRRGEITEIMGASGSGKSTLGKLLGGEILPNSGSIVWADALAADLDHYYMDQKPEKVFYPSQTVRKNLSYAPKTRGLFNGKLDSWVDQLLNDFRLTALSDRHPFFTSGGQQSRIALARVLSWKPKAIILDEYLRSLDPNTRDWVIRKLQHFAAAERMTIIAITHDMTEALRFADRCIIIGGQPVKVLADISMRLPHPRDERAPEYRAAQEALFEAVRHGYL